MSELTNVIQTILKRIKSYDSLYDNNEEAVRNQLINPMLRQIGWDPENPEDVQPNVYVEEGIPDYTLLKNGKKRLHIEAKKLSIDIEKKEIMKQLAKYSFNEGTKYGILTNGSIWIFIRSFEEDKPYSERIVWKLDLENDKLPSVVRKFQTISKENVEDIELLVKKIEILDETWTSLLEQPEEIIKGLIEPFKRSISEIYQDYEFADLELEDFLTERLSEIISSTEEGLNIPIDEAEFQIPKEWKTKANKIKIGNEEFETQTSRSILITTANWLIKKRKLTKSDCPISAGPKRFLINKEPKHRYGDDFYGPKQLSGGLWIETNYSRSGCIRKAKYLLKKFGFSPDILVIE